MNRPLAPGRHAPGHTAYLIQSGQHKMLIWGDIVHVAPVQLRYPAAAVRYDTDDRAAQRTRRAMLEMAARQHLPVGAAHISFPGLGHIRKHGAGYDWNALNYQADPAR